MRLMELFSAVARAVVAPRRRLGISTGHMYCSSLFHCVFSTRVRQNLTSPEFQGRVWTSICGIARENGMKTLAVGGMDLARPAPRMREANFLWVGFPGG